jgi:hypothetical protein
MLTGNYILDCGMWILDFIFFIIYHKDAKHAEAIKCKNIFEPFFKRISIFL